MAYANFKPTIWSKFIQTEIEKELVLANFCNTKFQGEVGRGKDVKIIGATRPAVKTYGQTAIDGPETPADTSVVLKIDQYKYTNWHVDDVDAAQSNGEIMSTQMAEAAKAHAEAADKYVGSIAADAVHITSSSSADAEAEAIALVDAAFVTLWTNGVRLGDEVELQIPPWFYNKIRSKLVALNTDNPQLLKTGVIGSYNGATVRMSNTLYNDTTDDYIMLRTRNAIAFASGIEAIEAFRPEKLFTDAVKTLHTYGAKIVRPKELYVIKAHNS